MIALLTNTEHQPATMLVGWLVTSCAGAEPPRATVTPTSSATATGSPTAAGTPSAGSVPAASPGPAASPSPAARQEERQPVVLTTSVHGTVTGWLVDFAAERNYMLNNILEHVDRLGAEPDYALALPEIPNLITIMDLAPERLEEVRRHVAQGRIDLSNAFFLNSTVNLSGGEALVRPGVEGIRWQQSVMGVRPRVASLIDTVGLHRQMPQIVRRLGLRGMVYTRNNVAGQATHRWRSPDGSSVLAVGAASYAHWSPLFVAPALLADEAIGGLKRQLDEHRDHDAPGAATLLLVAAGDYTRAPLAQGQVGHTLAAWRRLYSRDDARFGTLSGYFEQLEQVADRLELVEVAGDSPYSYEAFWTNIPRVKQWFRAAEHRLQGAEALATFASLEGRLSYPSADLYHAWINLLMNMDRSVLWGVGAGEVFESETTWDARDRFVAVTETASRVADDSLRAIAEASASAPSGADRADLTIFNPLNWERADPILLDVPDNRAPAGVPCEAVPDRPGLLCLPTLPPTGVRAFALGAAAATPTAIELSQTIETRFYTLRVLQPS